MEETCGKIEGRLEKVARWGNEGKSQMLIGSYQHLQFYPPLHSYELGGGGGMRKPESHWVDLAQVKVVMVAFSFQKLALPVIPLLHRWGDIQSSPPVLMLFTFLRECFKCF